MINYKKLYEKQYGKRKLVNASLGKFWGLRKFLKKYDWDRYFITEQLIEPGERILDIGCGNGHMLQKVKGKFQELYGMDISPSRLQEAKKKIEELYPSDISKFKFIEENADEPLPFSDNYFDTMNKFCWLFESQGFQIIIKSGSGFLAKFRNWHPSLLTGDLFIKEKKSKIIKK